MLGKHLLSVEPYLDRKQRSTKEPQRKASQPRVSEEPQVKEPCIVFVGPLLPNYINKGHIQSHFREYNNAITGIEFKGDRQRRGCHVLLTFKSLSSATRAIDQYNHTFLLGKHKLKLKTHRPMSSSTSSPTMPVSTASAMHYPNTKSKQKSSTEETKSPTSRDKINSLDQHSEVASNVIHRSVGYHSTGQLSSSRPTDCALGQISTSTLGIAAACKETVFDYSDSEDQLQDTVTTVIVENLDANVTQKEIESLTGVVITCYTPSHSTPDKVAAWIEVANSKHACTIAEKFDGKVVHGKKIGCFITDSHTLQEEMHSYFTSKNPSEDHLPSDSAESSPLIDRHNTMQLQVRSCPTFENPLKEPQHLSQNFPPNTMESFISGSHTIAVQQHTHSSHTFRDPPQEQPFTMPQPVSSHTAEQEYLALFFLGDQPPLQQLQPTFPQEGIAPFINPQLPIREPGPPVLAAPL